MARNKADSKDVQARWLQKFLHLSELQCLQKETEVQWIQSYCKVLGNNETANKGTVSIWRLSSHSARLTLSNPIFLPTAYSPALVLGIKEVGGLLVIILVLKEKNMEKQKEYNQHYLLTKVRTT
jgi:hypothetical protein